MGLLSKSSPIAPVLEQAPADAVAVADWWITSAAQTGASAERRKEEARKAVDWLKIALPQAHAHPEVKKKIKDLFAVHRFTGNLVFYGVYDDLRESCRESALALGEAMHAFYTRENLQSRLGSLSLPTRDGFHGSGRDILRQDNSLVGVPFEAILARTGDLGKVTTDSVSAMVLRLLALMLDDEFQAISKAATDAHKGTFKATEAKGHPRMMNKALSRDDHLLELSPRTMMNIDIVRNALTFDTVEDLTGAVGQLRQTLGDPVRVKNMFAFHKQRAEAQFHYRTLMINWLYDAQCTFRDLVERPQNVELLDTFKEAAPWNPNEPWCRWRRHAHLAVEILRSEQVGRMPVRMICETQLLLREYLKGRQKMHLLYKVYRASDQNQLYLDFRPKESEARTYSKVQKDAVEQMKRDLEGGKEKGVLLRIASLQGHLEVVQALLAAGADVNQARTKDGVTPLWLASQRGHLEVVQALVAAGADVDQARTDTGVTPLNIASEAGHLEVVQALVAAGADVNQAKTNDGTTPLYWASQKGYLEVVQALVAAGVDVNQARMKDGATPLFIASQKGHLEVVQALVAAGADVNQAKTDTGTTPLNTASQKGYLEVVQALVAAGAEK